MRIALLAAIALLSACTASVGSPGPLGMDLLFEESPREYENFSSSGTTFFGKFATASALNSHRLFLADYHGDMRLAFFPTGKIECAWSLEGTAKDASGGIEYLKETSTLCTGKLQRDGTFEFQGAYASGPMPSLSGKTLTDEYVKETFTLRGFLKTDTVTGDLVLGPRYANTAAVDSEKSDTTEGVRFEAVEQEEALRE